MKKIPTYGEIDRVDWEFVYDGADYYSRNDTEIVKFNKKQAKIRQYGWENKKESEEFNRNSFADSDIISIVFQSNQEKREFDKYGEYGLINTIISGLGSVLSEFCIYCDQELEMEDEFHADDKLGATGEWLQICSTCGWWVHSHHSDKTHKFSSGKRTEIFRVAAYGKMKTYELSDSNIPLRELHLWLAKHPTDLSSINPIVFERLIADCFRDTKKYVEVIHIGGVKDQGVDIKLVISEGESILVQVKRRSNLLATESVTTVRELNGVLLRKGFASGMVVSTARKFSKEAINESASDRDSLHRYNVDLLNFSNIFDLLQINPSRRIDDSLASKDYFSDLPMRRKS